MVKYLQVELWETARLWDAITGQHITTLSANMQDNVRSTEFISLAFSPEGSILAGGSWYGDILLWEVATGKHIRTLTGHVRNVSTVLFSPDGDLLISGSADGTILLFGDVWKE